MFKGLTDLHSTLRWLVLLAGLWAIIKMATGLSGDRKFGKSDKRPALFFLIFCDLQLLVGLVLYFIGPRGFKYFQTLRGSEIMQQTPLRFYAVEHAVAMVVAIVLVHIGFAATKSAKNSDLKKFSKAFYCFLVSFIIIIASIPWPFRPGLGMPLFPGMH